MREIKFRGKRIDNGEWIYGSLINKIKPTYETSTFWCSLIHDGALTATEVIPETVGQFTGLVDKNGVEIYEGDIVNQTQFGNEIEFVSFEDGCFVVKSDYTLNSIISDFKKEKIEVIGNIHDNPELLKQENQ